MHDLNALAIFVSVVEAGSFTGGAAALGLPKGSVSRKISGLEAALGVRLINRTTRKLSLTDVGRAYYEQCRKGLGELEAAHRLIDETQSVPTGVLRISAPADTGTGGLTGWIETYLRRYDQAKIELVLSDRYVDLIAERIDLAFRAGRLKDSSFVARRLMTNRRVLCASPGYLKRNGVPTSLDDLSTHDGIVHGDSVAGAVWRLHGPEGEVSIPVNGRVAGHNMRVVISAALAGLGVALIPDAVAHSDIKAKRLVRVLDQYAGPELGLYAVYPSSRQLSANVRAFLDIVVESINTSRQAR